MTLSLIENTLNKPLQLLFDICCEITFLTGILWFWYAFASLHVPLDDIRGILLVALVTRLTLVFPHVVVVLLPSKALNATSWTNDFLMELSNVALEAFLILDVSATITTNNVFVVVNFIIITYFYLDIINFIIRIHA